MTPDVDAETAATYAAEDAAAGKCRRFRRFDELATYVEGIVCSDWWDMTFPDAPVEVHVERRSSSATFSAARCERDHGVMWFVDGEHWTSAVACHELAHLTGAGDHDDRFRAALLELWREHLGFHASAALELEFRERGLGVTLK